MIRSVRWLETSSALSGQLFIGSTFSKTRWSCCISVMASVTFAGAAQTDSCRPRLSQGEGLKKDATGFGASVNNGVSSVTEEATIKVSKSGQGKNRHKLSRGGGSCRQWNKMQCWSFFLMECNGTRKNCQRNCTRECVRALCQGVYVNAFPSWFQSA